MLHVSTLERQNITANRLMTEKEYNRVYTICGYVYRFILKISKWRGFPWCGTDALKKWGQPCWIDKSVVRRSVHSAYHQMIDHIGKIKRISLRKDSRKVPCLWQTGPQHKEDTEEALAGLSEISDPWCFSKIIRITYVRLENHRIECQPVKVYFTGKDPVKELFVSPENVFKDWLSIWIYNRQNYEEFFVVYRRWFGPAERIAVEEFGQQHPDLK